METNETNKGKYTKNTFKKTQKQKIKNKKQNREQTKENFFCSNEKKNIPKQKYGLSAFFKH